MQALSCFISLLISLQVPAPLPGTAEAGSLNREIGSIHATEAKELEKLASELAGKGDSQAASEIRRLIPRKHERDGPSILRPLPEVSPAPEKGLASVSSSKPNAGAKPDASSWRAALDRIRSSAGAGLYQMAKRAAATNPPRYALAATCLREALERQPDHREVRRLLGYVSSDGGWARPFAVRQLKDGNLNHAIYGWVPADWVSHLEGGELPAPIARGQKKVRWLPAEEADRLRSNWKNPWQIVTEHFEIQTDVPLGEAITFARRLESFYDLFFTLMADVVGDNLPLARRLRSPSLTAEASYRPHRIYYFASKDEYLDRMAELLGPNIDRDSLGYYDPPKPGKGFRSASYFYRDAEGVLPASATLYHEVSHQLLFENAGSNGFTKNAGNYWVFEGMGTYFETVKPLEDGSLEFGGLDSPRIKAALHLFASGQFLPLDRFLLLDQSAFNRPDRIREHYQQAMALAIFLMQANDRAYREPFLDYARDAFRGRIKRTTGRSLEDRLGEPVRAIETRFREFLARGSPRG
jgi:hypothetical protein